MPQHALDVEVQGEQVGEFVPVDLKPLHVGQQRFQPLNGEKVAQDIAHRAGEESDDRSEGESKEHWDGDGRAEGDLADGGHTEYRSIVQVGEHKELLEDEKGLYNRLYYLQFRNQ